MLESRLNFPWEDDNDPRAKGLRGWDAARALCIGTGRALRDVKSVVNLAPGTGATKHLLNWAVLDINFFKS